MTLKLGSLVMILVLAIASLRYLPYFSAVLEIVILGTDCITNNSYSS